MFCVCNMVGSVGTFMEYTTFICPACLSVHYLSRVFLCQDCDVLETETKRFEDLEFQQLEHESRQDEEKENRMQQLLREIADYQRSTVTRKVTAIRLCDLEVRQCHNVIFDFKSIQILVHIKNKPYLIFIK